MFSPGSDKSKSEDNSERRVTLLCPTKISKKESTTSKFGFWSDFPMPEMEKRTIGYQRDGE